MPDGEEWAATVATRFALRMRWERDRLGWSAADLSKECSRLGYEIPRNVLSKIEGGYRKYVTLAEWLVISLALDVPPALFLVPIGMLDQAAGSLEGRAPLDARQSEGDGFRSYELLGDNPLQMDAYEVTPGITAGTRLGFDWLAGERHLTIDTTVNPEPWHASRLWKALVQDVDVYLERREQGPDIAGEDELRELQRRIRDRRNKLRKFRINPFPLPPNLTPSEHAAMDGGDDDA